MLKMHLYLELAIVLFFLMVAFIAINYNITNMVFGKKSNHKESKGILRVIPLVSAVISLLIGVVIIVVMA